MAASYSDVIAANVRAARARTQLTQGDVVERMRALGHSDWYRQTISRTERGERRLAAAEVASLALALETNIPVILGASPTGQPIEFGAVKITGRDVSMLASGRSTGTITWSGNKPMTVVSAWRGELEDDPAEDLV